MKKLFSLCTLALLAACATPGKIEQAQVLSFKQYQPININAARIEVVEEYQSPMRAPNVEHIIPYSPTDAMKIWVKDRLRAVGPDNILQVIVKEGSVVASDLPKKSGLEGFFTNDQDKRYDTKLSVEVRLYESGDALSKANVSASATNNFTMPEDASVSERNAAFTRMTNEIMTHINSELETNIFSYMGNYINHTRR